MHRLPSGSSVDRRDDPPSLAASLVLLAVTVLVDWKGEAGSGNLDEASTATQ